MSTRKLMIYIHLGIAAVFLPLMLMMPFTGSMYIWGFQGEQSTKEVFRIPNEVPKVEDIGEEGIEKYFRDVFKKQNIDFNFEYVRTTKTDYIFRPTSRFHYVANKADAELVFSEVTPNLMKRLIEVHKGHGPRMMRWFESIFGVSLVLVTLSGLWLAVTVPTYRKVTLISFAAGVAVIAVCLV